MVPETHCQLIRQTVCELEVQEDQATIVEPGVVADGHACISALPRNRVGYQGQGEGGQASAPAANATLELKKMNTAALAQLVAGTLIILASVPLIVRKVPMEISIWSQNTFRVRVR